MEYDKYLSEKAKNLKPSGIRKFFDVVVDIKDAISLGVGEPDFVTPWNIRHAAITSLKKGYTQYTSNSGLIELREQIAKYLKGYGLIYDYKKEIIVTVGASEGIDISLRAIINPGDEVLVPEPSYVSYAPCVELCGGIPVPLACTAEDCFKLRPENIEKAVTKKTKAVIFPYPNNPTGAVMEREYLKPVAEVFKKHDLIVLSDEIYSELAYYEGGHVSIASLPGMQERTVVLNGFSKAFAMTGWRIGYIAAPAEIMTAALKIHQYAIMCAPTMSQYAALEALKSGFDNGFEDVQKMRGQYDMRRRFVVSELNRIGLTCFEPMGAFYVFPSVKATGMDGEEFANALLKSQKVAVVPGSAFGDSCKDHVRISYAYSMKKLDAALSRIEEFLKEIK